MQKKLGGNQWVDLAFYTSFEIKELASRLHSLIADAWKRNTTRLGTLWKEVFVCVSCIAWLDLCKEFVWEKWDRTTPLFTISRVEMRLC